MYNLGDDSELDRLSREAAGRYKPSGSPNWQALSKELDKVMPVEKKKRRFLFWWILPALLLGGGVTYLLVNKNTADSSIIGRKSGSPEVGKSESKTPVEIKAKDDAGNKATESKQTQAAGLPVTDHPVNKIAFTKKERNTGLSGVDLTTVQADTKTKTAINVVIETTKPSEQQAAIISPAVAPSKASTDVQKDIVNENKQDDLKVEEQKQTATLTQSIEKEGPAETVPVENKPAKTNPTFSPRGKGLSFSLLAGVDKSTVKFKYGYTPGINLGLLVGYHFNDKWAIKTGGIYTQKNYKLAGEDFTAPKGTWVSLYKLEEVEGYCRMWEVPLLVSYTISNTAKKSVTLNTGLSSYFMTNENYDYSYYYNGLPITRGASYNSTDTHVMSIVHLSAGFEKRVSNKMSLLVEPYAKIPLGGVGFGNIRLSSFGINFSVQYRQPTKK